MPNPFVMQSYLTATADVMVPKQKGRTNKHSLNEWSRIYNIALFDLAGFSTYKNTNTGITETEFFTGLNASTSSWKVIAG